MDEHGVAAALLPLVTAFCRVSVMSESSSFHKINCLHKTLFWGDFIPLRKIYVSPLLSVNVHPNLQMRRSSGISRMF